MLPATGPFPLIESSTDNFLINCNSLTLCWLNTVLAFDSLGSMAVLAAFGGFGTWSPVWF